MCCSLDTVSAAQWSASSYSCRTRGDAYTCFVAWLGNRRIHHHVVWRSHERRYCRSRQTTTIYFGFHGSDGCRCGGFLITVTPIRAVYETYVLNVCRLFFCSQISIYRLRCIPLHSGQTNNFWRRPILSWIAIGRYSAPVKSRIWPNGCDPNWRLRLVSVLIHMLCHIICG